MIVQNKRNFFAAAVMLFYAFANLSCNGKAEDLFTGSYLGDGTIGGGGSRNDGSNSGQIYTVTNIVEATNDIPEWTNADLPFNNPRRSIGTVTTDSNWPFKFTYTYPANNYSLGEAHLIFATSRDSSDTEGIFIDGVFTGRPPASFVSTTSTKVLYKNYVCAGGTCSGSAVPSATPNFYFMDWALTHYKIGSVNTFDLDISKLLTSTPLTIDAILNDGVVRVVSGDDAFIETDTATASRPLLTSQGYTISKAPLTCSQSPTYKLINRYIHNDGNSISQSAFTGTVLSPVNSSSTAYSTIRTVEFFYDPRLPTLASYANLNITQADIVLNISRANSGAAAIVVNGIGFDQTGFDRTPATSAIESWSTDMAAITYFSNLVNAIPTTNVSTPVTINLITLLGAAKVKELLLQGKLNIAVSGPIATVYGQAATSTRTYGVAVAGPELVLAGNFSAEICLVPNDPTSPLSGATTGPVSCTIDLAAPIISSIQVSAITSTSATVQWLTNENSSSQVGYGVSVPTTATPDNVTGVTFHSVNISGLQPYKYYQYNVRSTDSCGNMGTSATKTFRTLR